MMINMIKCVIFDLDDTLYNERTYVEAAMLNVAEYFNEKYDLSTKESYDELINILDKKGRGKIFDEFMVNHNLNEDVGNIVNVYRNTKPSLKMYDDAGEIIGYLKEKKILLGIITDGCSKVQHNKVSGLNIWKVFDDIVITDDYKNYAKPSVMSYQLILDRHRDIAPNECMYIGDNPHKDFIGAKASGMMSVRIIREEGQHMNAQVPEEMEADIRIHSLMEILEYI